MGVPAAGVMRGAVEPSQQLPERRVERGVALRAAHPAGLPEIAQGCPTARALHLERRLEGRIGLGAAAQGSQKAAERSFGDARPGSATIIVKALVMPEWLIEIEAVAAAKA